MPLRTMSNGGAIAGALAAILILILLMTGRLAAEPALRDGDLVFQQSQSRQSAAILAATGSPLTHMGIVHMRDGSPYVIEAWKTVRETPLADWIARGDNGRYRVYRYRDLTAEQAAAAIAEALAMEGRPYDPFFRPGDDAIYCSELVRLAFAAAGIDLGDTETVGDLDTDRPAVHAIFAERWRMHPDCGDAGDEQACWERIAIQPIVTPASIAADSRLALIHSDL